MDPVRVDLSNLRSIYVGDGWLTMFNGVPGRPAGPGSVETHHMRLDAITAWHQLGQGRVTLFAPGVQYVVGCRATSATMTEPARYDQTERLAAALGNALFDNPAYHAEAPEAVHSGR